MANTANRLPSTIPGWGVDLESENRPGIPKERKPQNGTGAHWKEPEKQIATVKIYHTIERPGLTPVFGTTCPPKGLSGLLRDVAYRFGEGRLSHWLMLVLADRVDVIETIVVDIVRGRAGNPLSEMGLKTEFKERGGFSRFQRRRLAVALGIGAAGLITAKALKRAA